MIHQLQATYLHEHDRILVRVNTRNGEEFRLWLTRSMVKGWLELLKQATTDLAEAPVQNAAPISHDGTGAAALAQFRQQESVQTADFKTPFAAHATRLPIGNEPLLATTATITPTDDGRLRLAFEEKIPGAANNRSFEMTLGPDMRHGFVHLIERALKHADWGFGLAAAKPDSAPMDLFATTTHTGYLN